MKRSNMLTNIEESQPVHHGSETKIGEDEKRHTDCGVHLMELDYNFSFYWEKVTCKKCLEQTKAEGNWPLEDSSQNGKGGSV